MMSRFLWVFLGSSLLGSCIYDPDNPCGKHQYYENGECLCEREYHSNATTTGCIPCGENEFGVGDLCVCEEGFSRATEDGPCQPLGEALGRACDPDSNPCTDPVFSFCYVPEDGTEPYCTKQNCTFNEDCGSLFGCEVRAETPFCKKYPPGLGLECSSNDECAAGEAKYCDTVVSRICLVDNCASPEVTCYANTVCCDYAPVGTPISVCVDPRSLQDGKCQLGGVIVEQP